MLTLRAAAAIAVMGTALHDLVEFGRPSEQNTLVTLIVVAAFVALTERSPRWRSTGMRALAAFTVLMLVGAVASVFPLTIWPFEPEQSITHYAVHALWATSLCPLLLATTSLGVARPPER